MTMIIISIILLIGFLYFLGRNFHQDNYGYAFVMYIGAVVFYANLYDNLPEDGQFWLMLITILALIAITGGYVYRAVTATSNERHRWYAVALGILATVLAIIFKFIL
ncbi:MAG TPA: hypothetical protein H9720_06380 [Candidatus Limosilactobacillus intestinigallinarum]|nr:hypothetical protein [Candidatus Limosilactobacillus intestinigallinarum]